MKKLLILLMGMLTALVAPAQTTKSYVIKGQIVDRAESKLVLMKLEDHFSNPADQIELEGSTFEYKLHGAPHTPRILAFASDLQRGHFRPLYLFLDQDTIHLTLYPEERFDENRIIGGTVNQAYQTFNAAIAGRYGRAFEALDSLGQELERTRRRYSPAFNDLISALADADQDQKVAIYREMEEMDRAGLHLSPEGSALTKTRDSLNNAAQVWQYRYLRENPSEMAFLFLTEDLKYRKNDPQIVENVSALFPEYAARYPEHSYTEVLRVMLHGVKGIQVGGFLIDFQAEDLTGQARLLSELMSDEIMLINFWGSWCGPCIAKTRTMIPLFQAYKDRGFGVVGIAREFGSTQALEHRLSKEAFDWVNLVDLDDRQEIWKTYGMSNAAGMMLLVTQDGVILAVDPSADQVRTILEERLGIATAL